MIVSPTAQLSRDEWRTFGAFKRCGGLASGVGPARDLNLTKRAFQIAAEKYGPGCLSEDHAEAFMYMAGRLTHLANGYAREALQVPPKAPLRLAYGLACGGGKTLTAQSWIAAVHETGKRFSVCYAASEVEALCDIKRALETDFGVPSEKIGILHSYKCDPERAAAGVQGYASLPSTPDGELHQKQFLLVTHSLVQTGKPALDRYYTYGPQRRPRDLVIYDESLLVSDAWSLQIKHAEHGVNWLRTEVKYGGERTRILRPILRYAEDCLSRLTSVKDSVVRLPAIGDYGDGLEADMAVLMLPESCPGAIRTLIRGTNREVRVLIAGGHAAAWFTLKVPDELQNVFVLDASYMIRSLPRLTDSNVKPDPVAPPVALDYSGLTIETFKHPAGRGTIEAECKRAWQQRTLARKLAEWIKALPEDSQVLVWTFKQRGIGVDVPGRLKEALARHGCDLSRIRILTHGRAKGSNDYQDARAVAWYGVLEPEQAVTSAQMLGELRQLDADIKPHNPARVHANEILHELYQEAQRCNVRSIVNGRAGEARMFIPCWHQNVIQELAADYVCPGAKLIYRADLEPQDVRARFTENQTSRVSSCIAETLRHLPKEVDSISAKRLRSRVSETLGRAVTSDVWKSATLTTAIKGWRRRGRSWVRC